MYTIHKKAKMVTGIMITFFEHCTGNSDPIFMSWDAFGSSAKRRVLNSIE